MDNNTFYKLYSTPSYNTDTTLFSSYKDLSVKTKLVKLNQQSLFTNHELQVSNHNYINREINNHDFVFPFLVGNLIVIMFVFSLYRKQVINSVLAIFSNKYYQRIESKAIIKHPANHILFLLFIVNISLVIYLLLNRFSFSSNLINNPYLFLIITASVLLYYSLKATIISVSSYIFNTPKYGTIYINYLIIWAMNIALFLSVFLWLETYAYNQLLFPLFITLWLVLSGLRILNSLLRIIPKSDFKSFHFFVYLCTVEILPLIVLGKLVMLGIK